MLKNYFRIAWRNLLRGKVYSLILIVGLATGMAVALIIGLWIWNEITFDREHENYKTLAEVEDTQTFNGETGTWPGVAAPVARELRTTYANYFQHIALSYNTTNILAIGDNKISRTGKWAEPDLPDMLTLQMIDGSRKGLKDPSSILISESTAKALFGDRKAVDQTVLINNKTSMRVTGIYKDLSRNSSFYETDFLLPWDNHENYWWDQGTNWANHGPQLYVQLAPNADIEKINAQIATVTQPHYREGNEHISLHPMAQWHLYSEFKNGKVAGGRIQFVWLFGIISWFVLLLACINFMNLSTARSEKRAKEVGIRKAIGSLRGQLIGQFLCESLTVAFLAMILSIGLGWASLSFFNHLADKDMSIPWGNPGFWLITLGFTFFTGIVAGSYPAFYLSGFQPIKVLKGTFRLGKLASLPRKVLVVIQFTVSISLIIGTIVVFRQIKFAKSRSIGYTRQGLVTIDMNTPDIFQHYNSLRDELIATGAVQNMSESNSSPTEIWSDNSGFDWEGKDPSANPDFGTIAVTHDFGPTVGWQINDGRDFSRDFQSDTGGFILNEAALKIVGLKDPIGKKMQWFGKEHIITGIVKNMIMESPYKPPVPTVFYLSYQNVRLITLRLKNDLSLQESLTRIEPIFKRYNPGSPFQYKIIDEEFARKFSDEERIGNLATFFAFLAIFISCLGLFGLASFITEQRTKEIGIRKVLGASVFHLWRLLSRDFAQLVIISFLISIPIAWYFLTQWLQRYDYRTNVSWEVFAIAGICAMFTTLLTVSFQTIKAALASPTRSLRSE